MSRCSSRKKLAISKLPRWQGRMIEQTRTIAAYLRHRRKRLDLWSWAIGGIRTLHLGFHHGFQLNGLDCRERRGFSDNRLFQSWRCLLYHLFFFGSLLSAAHQFCVCGIAAVRMQVAASRKSAGVLSIFSARRSPFKPGRESEFR